MKTSLQILLIDDEQIVHQTLGDYLRESEHYVVSSLSAAEGLNILQTGGFDLVISDVRMPGMDGLGLLQRLGEQYPELSVVIMTGHGNVDMAVQALRLGAADFLTKPIKLLELDAVLERSIRLRALQKENTTLHATVDHLQLDSKRENNHALIGESDHVHHLREQIMQVVQTGCDTVMVTGETGTGKEVIAREIHRQFDGGDRPFIAVSCPTIPANLVESELFGAAKGSYTGATEDRQGLFELAHNGILFLDEISDLSPAAQAAMLRVLETRRIRPVGGAREVSVDVRVIAASNTPLEAMTSDGRFRRDLLFRLNLFTIHLLPLRDRPEDIIPLANYFLEQYQIRRGVPVEEFADGSLDGITRYSFPGNIRELRNLVERSAMLNKAGPVNFERPAQTSNIGQSVESDESEPSIGAEHAKIVQALEAARWNRKQAASDLKIPYSTLRYKMRRLGIK